MGRSLICGFEMGSLAEGIANGPCSVQSAIVRSGNFAYRANPVLSNASISFVSLQPGSAGARPIFKSSRFFIQVAALPSGPGPARPSVAIMRLGGAGTFNPEVDLSADGTLTIADSVTQTIATSIQSLSVDGLWHRVEVDVGYGIKVYVDGSLWVSGGTTLYLSAGSISFGAGASARYVNATCDLYFDDILVDSESFSITGLPGDGHAVLLLANGDPSNLNHWTGGAGGSVGLFQAVSAIPPGGLAAGGATDASQIKNEIQSGGLDYVPSVRSYADVGIGPSNTVNAVMAICNDGVESARKTAEGGLWVASNPTQSSPGTTFDFGDGSSAAGNFPLGWRSHYGPVSVLPVLDLNATPAVAVRKVSKSSIAADVDFLGVYVDYV